VSHGRVVGMISRRDIIAVLARQDARIEAEVDEALREAGVECNVEVDEGVVHLTDGDDPESLEVARVIASRVPGVVGVFLGSLA
jgi:CBS domain-containing protein